MLASLIAERYAKALLRAAQAEKALDVVGPQAQGLSQALQSAQGAQRFLADPTSEPGAKLAVIAAAFEGGPHAVLNSFLAAVLAHKRERFLPLILLSFIKLFDEAEGRVEASLGTARPLATAELKLLEGELSRRLGRSITLKPYTEKELLGGAVLRLGDTVYDASLSSRLKRLGQLLNEGPAFAEASAGSKSKSKKASAKAPAKAPASAKASAGSKAKAKPKAKAKAKATAKPKAKAASKPKAQASAKASAGSKAKAKPKPKAGKSRSNSGGQALAAKLLKKSH